MRLPVDSRYLTRRTCASGTWKPHIAPPFWDSGLQSLPMAVRAQDRGKSECRSVMGRITTQDQPQVRRRIASGRSWRDAEVHPAKASDRFVAAAQDEDMDLALRAAASSFLACAANDRSQYSPEAGVGRYGDIRIATRRSRPAFDVMKVS